MEFRATLTTVALWALLQWLVESSATQTCSAPRDTFKRLESLLPGDYLFKVPRVECASVISEYDRNYLVVSLALQCLLRREKRRWNISIDTQCAADSCPSNQLFRNSYLDRAQTQRRSGENSHRAEPSHWLPPPTAPKPNAITPPFDRIADQEACPSQTRCRDIPAVTEEALACLAPPLALQTNDSLCLNLRSAVNISVSQFREKYIMAVRHTELHSDLEACGEPGAPRSTQSSNDTFAQTPAPVQSSAPAAGSRIPSSRVAEPARNALLGVLVASALTAIAAGRCL